MAEVLYYAFPYFVLLLVVEFLSFKHLESDGMVGYDIKDSRTSITMGIGNVIINVGWKFAVLAAYAALYELAPWHLPTDAWWVWVALFFADDFSYYWFHRVSHENRTFWASHVVHHSSQHYNLSTALRQTWVPMTYAPFWMWMPLAGFPPWMILLAQAWSLIFQFGIHTERIGRLPRPIEAVVNTPSHHRVHHGSNEQYLDKNYGGILIIWDRLFGTYEPEDERVRYGLTTNIETYNPVQVAFHEYIALWRDVRAAPTWRAKWGHAWHGPGWAPDPERVPSRDDRAVSGRVVPVLPHGAPAPDGADGALRRASGGAGAARAGRHGEGDG